MQIKILDSYNKKRIWVESCGSLGKYPLKNFKFVEHKKNKQLNGYEMLSQIESLIYAVFIIIDMCGFQIL